MGKTVHDRLSGLSAFMFPASALATVAAWLAFMLKVPAHDWTERPLPFPEIHQNALMIGPISDTMVLLLLLLVAYLMLVSVTWMSPDDLPVPVVLAVAAVSGLSAMFTYALFAEDVNVLLANVWAYAIGGVNPYTVAPSEVPGNPYRPFTSWGHLQYQYGPAWLLVGAAVMSAVGPGVLPNVGATKLLLLSALWLMGVLAWQQARTRGSAKPMGAAALVLWNPLLLIDGPMTPHLDLPMATALVAGLLAWGAKREAVAVVLLSLSVALKFITAMLGPAVLLSLVAAGPFRGPRRRNLVWAIVLTVAAFALLWPGVWHPFMQYGLQWSVEVTTTTALIPNVITVLQAGRLLPPEQDLDPVAVAKDLRWVTFGPIWAVGTVLTVLLARKQRRELPLSLFEPFALLLLTYHVLFTLAVLPWHFTTTLCLCLIAGSRLGRWAGALVTLGGMLFYANETWVWRELWPDQVLINWILGASLLTGPIVAMILLSCELWARYRTVSRTDSAGLRLFDPDPSVHT